VCIIIRNLCKNSKYITILIQDSNVSSGLLENIEDVGVLLAKSLESSSNQLNDTIVQSNIGREFCR